jgi:hypothetical protein
MMHATVNLLLGAAREEFQAVVRFGANTLFAGICGSMRN